jgi:hypothetical protein
MNRSHLSQFKNGWFIGDFAPTIAKTQDFEVCVKTFLRGDIELTHFQKIATEITVVLSGSVRMGEYILEENDILTIYKDEICDFEALTDCKVMGIKFPSLPDDKVIV